MSLLRIVPNLCAKTGRFVSLRAVVVASKVSQFGTVLLKSLKLRGIL